MRLSHGNRASCKVGVPDFVFRPLLTEESNRRSSVQTHSDRSIGHGACRMAIGYPAKSGCPLLYAILPTEEANRRLSVQTPSDRSIDHALVA